MRAGLYLKRSRLLIGCMSVHLCPGALSDDITAGLRAEEIETKLEPFEVYVKKTHLISLISLWLGERLLLYFYFVV